MHPVAAALLQELEAEAATTRRVLERVPGDRLDWRPHPKSMSLGQLALHVASIPGSITRLATLDELDAATVDFTPAACESKRELLAALDATVADTRAFLETLDAARAEAPWTLRNGAAVVFTVPRLGLLRSIGFNHWYHHRGQLLVYLRLLDVPVPVVYGRSADENPFAVAV